MAKTKAPKPLSAGPDPALDHIRAGRRQIEEAGGALAWLVAFVRQDASQWLPGDREAHGYRLLSLVIPAPDFLVTHRERIIPLDSADVDALHAELQETFKLLVSAPAGTSIQIPTEGLGEALVRATAPGVKPATWGHERYGAFKTLLFQVLKAEILENGSSLIACPYCGKPLLALRKKKFCDAVCLQRWHDARRESRKERTTHGETTRKE